MPSDLRVSFRRWIPRAKCLTRGGTCGSAGTAPAPRRAIAESLGETPGTTAPHRGNPRHRKGGRLPASATGGNAAGSGTGFQGTGRHAEWDLARYSARSATPSRATGHRLSALVDAGPFVALASSDRVGAARGHARRCDPAPRPPGSPHRPLRPGAPQRHGKADVQPESASFGVCPHCGVWPWLPFEVTPAELPVGRASFNALYEQVRKELIDIVFRVTAVWSASWPTRRSNSRRVPSAWPRSAPSTTEGQLEQLVFPGL